MKFLNFFLFLCVIFALLNPDPDQATRIYADPDPKPWTQQIWQSVVITAPAIFEFFGGFSDFV